MSLKEEDPERYQFLLSVLRTGKYERFVKQERRNLANNSKFNPFQYVHEYH
ncbi:hypothetical protein [Methanobacterium spitsbergense]|uniref:Uncharacterized protein n=1 Tax=Methanobacterium spitsbergense TaxID=2874285 RepID=A0A8T5UVR8_9EURY|nr:hypothetical protein [Methanobacterium spitsbergense]MBZ2166347.1 hypothetical protein [Methanobacterium spitsbergense]